MIKSELLKHLSIATNLNLEKSRECFEALSTIIAAELLDGGEVSLPAIGKLSIKKTRPRKGRNPKTGEMIEIPAGKKVVLKIGKEFKDALKKLS